MSNPGYRALLVQAAYDDSTTPEWRDAVLRAFFPRLDRQQTLQALMEIRNHHLSGRHINAEAGIAELIERDKGARV